MTVLYATNSQHYIRIADRLTEAAIHVEAFAPRPPDLLAKLAGTRHLAPALTRYFGNRPARTASRETAKPFFVADALPRSLKACHITSDSTRQLLQAQLLDARLVAQTLANQSVSTIHAPAGCIANAGKLVKRRHGSLIIEQRGLPKAQEVRRLRAHGAEPPTPQSDKLRSRMEWEQRAADLIVCASLLVQEALIEEGICASKVAILPLPVDFEVHPLRSFGARRFDVLYVGPWTKQKGAQTLIHAATQEDCGPFHWCLVGPPPGLDESWPGGFTKFEPMPRLQLQALYAQASVTVVASLVEAYSMVAMESLAAGTPVVVSDGAGVAQDIKDHNAGWTFEAGNPASLAASLNQALGSAEQLAARARAGQCLILERSTSSYVAGLLGIYRRLGVS